MMVSKAGNVSEYMRTIHSLSLLLHGVRAYDDNYKNIGLNINVDSRTMGKIALLIVFIIFNALSSKS